MKMSRGNRTLSIVRWIVRIRMRYTISGGSGRRNRTSNSSWSLVKPCGIWSIMVLDLALQSVCTCRRIFGVFWMNTVPIVTT